MNKQKMQLKSNSMDKQEITKIKRNRQARYKAAAQDEQTRNIIKAKQDK